MLKNERTLLTNQFVDINNKFDGLKKEQEHLLNSFINQKENQKVDIDKSEVESGRFFSDAEDKSLSQVAVLGYKIKDDLFGDSERFLA